MGDKYEKVIVKDSMCAGCDCRVILPGCIDFCLDIKRALLNCGGTDEKSTYKNSCKYTYYCSGWLSGVFCGKESI